MTNKTTISEFFITDYPSFGSYDNIRKLGSYIDGCKLSQRKVIYTLLKKYSNPNNQIKTARLASSIAEFTEYVHGEQSLTGVLDSMAASFTGSNNFPLIIGHGNFGSRFSGFGSAAAPRYTHISISKLLLDLFTKDDIELCPSLIFEGSEIEPQFFMPTFPIILLNGIEGISSGWKTLIYPRNPEDILQYMSDVINNKNPKNPEKFIPFFKNFKGITKIEKVERNNIVENVFVNYGIIKQETSTKLRITEIPIGFDHASYIKILDRLVENQSIVDYEDLSDPKTDLFEFVITVRRIFFDKYKNEKDWIELFRLSKNLNEQINCINENNQVVEYSSIKELLDDFIKIRLEYCQKRKNYLIEKLTNELLLNVSRYLWCQGIIEETIKVKNILRNDIIKQLEKNDKIIKVNDSYNYLLNMPITSITKEKMDELKKEIQKLKNEIKEIKQKTNVDLMNSDIESNKEIFK